MLVEVKNSCVCDERSVSDEFLCKRGENESRTFAKVMTNFLCNGEGGGQEMQGGGENRDRETD